MGRAKQRYVKSALGVLVVRHRHTDHLTAAFSWLEAELSELLAHPHVNVYLYVTGPSSTRSSSESELARPSKSSSDTEIFAPTAAEKKTRVFQTVKSAPGSSRNHFRGRPDVDEHVYRAMNGYAEDARMFVGGEFVLCPDAVQGSKLDTDTDDGIAGCGPDQFLSAIRATVIGRPVSGTPSVKLCLEEFTY